MSIKKISELSTKSFLGGAGAAANSYVLINYEDNSTSEPITYKATIQELGKAIANDLQLYKKTQDGAVTTSVNNGAYVDGTAKDFIELRTPKNVQINGAGDLGYYTTALSESWTPITKPVDMDFSQDYYKYLLYDTTNENYVMWDPTEGVMAPVTIGGNSGGGGSDAPYETYFTGEAYNYLIYNESMGLCYSSDGETAEHISLYSMDLSGDTYYYMGMSNNIAGIPNSVGDLQVLGRPVFYDDTTSKIGYYNSEGFFTEVTSAELGTGV